MESTQKCNVCEANLVPNGSGNPLKCSFCGKEMSAPAYCPHGHLACETCARLEPLAVLQELLTKTTSRCPAEILELMMSHPRVPMHGPIHHVFVPVAIVAAVRNTGYPLPPDALLQAFDRGAKVPGGWCGLAGACGAALGVGIAVSVVTQSTPLTGKNRTLALGATSRTLSQMLDNHPRCCKKASREALDVAVDFLHEKLGIKLLKGESTRCHYSARNRECIKEACPYYAPVGSIRS
ncbi:MAG: DUF5714 domain-containing protein [Chloroflexota bacterium]